MREVGTRESLMAERGFYFEVIEPQWSQFDEELSATDASKMNLPRPRHVHLWLIPLHALR